MLSFLGNISIIIPIILPGLGSALGQSRINRAALQAIDIQPQAYNDIARINFIGCAITETAAILGTIIAMLLLFDTQPIAHIGVYYARFGIALAIGISGCICSYFSAAPAESATLAIARQPFFSAKIINILLVTQSIVMTPNIFGFLISLLIMYSMHSINSDIGCRQAISAGLVIGLGCIGPAYGLSTFTSTICKNMGISRKAYNPLLTFTFLCCAIIETPVIFSLIVALSILTRPIADATIIKGIAFLAAALSMGLSTLTAGISAGNAASAAAESIALQLDHATNISRLTMIILALLDTFAIYGLLIAMILIIFV